MSLSPVITIHLTSALATVALGPVALWARKGATVRPKLHRAFGYAWVTVMLATALSAMFIRDYRGANVLGYTYIHLLVLVAITGISYSFYSLAKGNIEGHRKSMQRVYYGACLGAGFFALAPGRFLGNLIWSQWLGLM